MTPLNTYDVYQSLLSEVNIQQRGQVRPVADFEKWYNKISMELFRERVAAAELSQQLDDDLAPFKKVLNIIITPQPGYPNDLVRYPSDYEGFAGASILRQRDGGETRCNCEYPIYKDDGECLKIVDPDYAAMQARYAGESLIEAVVTKIDTQRWNSCLNHANKQPTLKNPKIVQDGTGFRIAPKGITSMVLTYYRTPRNAVFGYTLSPEDIVIYDPLTSVDLEWSSTLKGEIMARLKKIYAGHVGDGEIYQQAQNDLNQLS